MAVSIIILAILALFAGVVLGYLSKVFLLIPVIAVVLVGVLGVGLARADDAWSIGLAAVGVTIALQMGYLIGGGVRAYRVARKTAGLAQSRADRMLPRDSAKKDGPGGQGADNQPECA